MKNQIMLLVFISFFTAPTLNSFAWATSKAASSATSKKEELKVVPVAEVCMVNNTHFARPQIPVQVEGKTYYGCCENCKTTLSVDVSSRYGVEALTGEKIDKAKAVIAARADGSVLYFANEKNLKAFQGKSAKP